ncbi:hypothetical protein O181_002663 [Austropuccinia psidii MF-1]|uniref:Uncharacterized protein n=1 Tax=Austropuccinia psidii MF-1 TaxID=1389203 RepID=A0A9Q3BCX7_9BASI|nr:hypothetical protein [Austropuccinia psidii MF-1]
MDGIYYHQKYQGMAQKKREESKAEAPVGSPSEPQANRLPNEGKINKKKNWSKSCSPSYSIPIIQKYSMDNVFNMARTWREFKEKEEKQMRQPSFPKK